MKDNKMTIKNAIINNAKIHFENGGILTVWLGLDYGGSGQGFGGYSLHLPKSYKHYKIVSRLNGCVGEIYETRTETI